MLESVNIPSIFTTIVDAMRDTYSITSITDQGDDTYVVATADTKDLADDDYMTISGTTNFEGQYLVSGLVADTSFIISKTSGLSTETGTWTANKPYFLYGHLDEIVRRLLLRDDSQTYKWQKYPLIILAYDVEERIDNLNHYGNISPNIIICNFTKKEYFSEERIAVNFVAILEPLYIKLIQAMADSGLFLENKPEQIARVKTNRLYWGTTELNTGSNKMTDPIDAIELRFDNLRIKGSILKCS